MDDIDKMDRISAGHCARCGKALTEDVRFCSQCGTARDSHNQAGDVQSRINAEAPNRLLFRQTTSESLLEAAFTDATAQQLADVIQSLVAGRILRPADAAHNPNEPGLLGTTVEATPSIGTSISNPAPELSTQQPVESDGGLHRVFTVQNGVTRLVQADLKAKSAKDYSVRLTQLFLCHNQQQTGLTEVPKSELHTFLESVGIKKTDYQPAISREQSIQKSKSAYRLSFAVEQLVKRYLSEIADPSSEGEWYPGKEGLSASPRRKRSGKRSPSTGDGDLAAPETWGEDMRQLQQVVKTQHGEVGQWQTLQLGLLGLYGIRMVYGAESDASPRHVTQLLYKAFELSAREDTVRKALERAVKSSDRFVNPGEAGGYRITPTGCRHVEDLLKLHQLELVRVDAAPPSNGAAQS